MQATACQAIRCGDMCRQGLLHFDGIDSMGRPIIIVNARAAAASDINLRPLAVKYMMQRLDPIVYAVRFYILCKTCQATASVVSPHWSIQELALWATFAAITCMSTRAWNRWQRSGI